MSNPDVGDRVAYVDEWGPGPYHGTVTYHCDGVYHVVWDDGREGPIMVQHAERLSLLDFREDLVPHPNPEVHRALKRIMSGLVMINDLGYSVGHHDTGPYLFNGTERIELFQDADEGWYYEVEDE